MTTNPGLPEITPLQERAIRRFEHDRDFYNRVYAAAHALELTPAGEGKELPDRLRDAMTALQEADEQVLSDAAITNGARYIGESLLGLNFDTATVAEQEGMKAGVRRVLAAAKEIGA